MRHMIAGGRPGIGSFVFYFYLSIWLLIRLLTLLKINTHLCPHMRQAGRRFMSVYLGLNLENTAVAVASKLRANYEIIIIPLAYKENRRSDIQRKKDRDTG